MTQEALKQRLGLAQPNRGSVGFQEALAQPEQEQPAQPEQEQPAQPEQEPPFSVQQAYAMAQVCLDLHEALGCKWGDNPYLAIAGLREAQPQQEPLTDEEELSNGFAMALHDAVLIRIGADDEATQQATARIDKLVNKYKIEAAHNIKENT